MTDSNYTHIAMLSDRSGSMDSIRSDAEGGINTLIRDQQATPGRATLTLVEFDSTSDTVYDFVDLKTVPDPAYHLIPRGNTALQDAMGALIGSTGAKLAALPEAQRPGLVMFVVMTDGYENSSREVTAAALKAMVDKHTTEFAWKFVFLGANQDAFATGARYGIGRAQTISFAATPDGTSNVYASTSSNLSGARVAMAAGAVADFAYSDADRDAANQ